MKHTSLVPQAQLAQGMLASIKYLQTCAELSDGRATLVDIVRSLASGRMQLWLVHDETAVNGVIITGVTKYPQCKKLTIHYVTMDVGTLALVTDATHEALAEFAKKNECDGIECLGRSGWRNDLRKHGYVVSNVHYHRPIELH